MQEFNDVRSYIGEARLPRETATVDPAHFVQMTAADGLETIGQCSSPADEQAEQQGVPRISTAMIENRRLWVVRVEDAVSAEERGPYGQTLPGGVIKHTNLTGGLAAYSGGELLYLGEGEIVINGCSGRYGPRSADEMRLIELAFAKLGFRVWSMGYDEDAGRPLYFGVTDPQLVAA